MDKHVVSYRYVFHIILNSNFVFKLLLQYLQLTLQMRDFEIFTVMKVRPVLMGYDTVW